MTPAANAGGPAGNPGAAAKLSNSDFTVFIGGKKIKPGDDIENAVEARGSDYEYSEAISCEHDGMDKTYSYNNVEFYTYPDGSADRIDEIMLITPDYQTYKGIGVNDSLEKVIDAYGAGYSDKNEYYITYEGPGGALRFYLTGDTVTGVSIARDGYQKDDNSAVIPTGTGNEELDKAIGDILSQIIKPGMSGEEKLKAVYNHMLDYGWRPMNVDLTGGYTDQKIAELALYLVRNGKGSCEHIACLEVELIRALGYEAEPVIGQRTAHGVFVSHHWARVYIDGVGYNFDPGFVFLKTDEEIISTHHS